MIERHIGLRAVSKGTHPDDEVAPNAARGLEADGLGHGSEIPQRLSPADIEAAIRVVAFCSLPEGKGGSERIEVWDDVPPGSDDYERARDAIVERIGRLLDDLAEPARGTVGGRAL